MSSPVKALTKSQEHLELLLASLSKTSLSPRGRLIGLLESADNTDLSELTSELAENVANYSALELAVGLYALRQHPQPKTIASVLAGGLLELASKLSTYDTCSHATWNRLLGLLTDKSQIRTLAGFLQTDEGFDSDTLDDEFVYSICTRLANILRLEILDLHPILLATAIEPWIDRPFLQSSDCISALLLTFYMCSYERADSWDLEGVSARASAKEFVLEAISKSAYAEKTEDLLKEFTFVLDKDSWHYVRDLTPRALETLLTVIKKCNFKLDANLVLAILDNTENTWEQKFEFAIDIIDQLPQLSSSFLFAVFSKIHHAIQRYYQEGVNQELIETEKDFIEQILNKPWYFNAIDINVEHTDFSKAYKAPVETFINRDVPAIINTLYSHDPEGCILICDKIKRKMISAIVEQLALFAEINKARLDNLPAWRRDYRTQSGLKIKTACVGLIFFLYDAIETRKKKKHAFTFLKKEIRPITTTLDNTESKVKKVYQAGIPALSYADGEHVLYRIHNPSRQLPSQTPRAEGVAVD